MLRHQNQPRGTGWFGLVASGVGANSYMKARSNLPFRTAATASVRVVAVTGALHGAINSDDFRILDANEQRHDTGRNSPRPSTNATTRQKPCCRNITTQDSPSRSSAKPNGGHNAHSAHSEHQTHNAVP